MNRKISRNGLEIAVIGMAGRFPGAPDIHTFWENLKNGRESVTFFTDEELLEAGVTAGNLENPDYVKAKGYIEDLRYFDSSFFNYTPREVELMDPQVRLFHQCAWHALEDAGYDPWSHKGSIGVYAGYNPDIFWKVGHLYQMASDSETFDLNNLSSNNFATLICYKLNLKGPGVSLNTACSTSLVAVHMACRALLTGESEMVLAGGVDVTLPPKNGYFYQEGMIMSPDGHCRSFDADAKGTASGDGIGIVVMKRLVKATKDGDHIYAIIKGSAINNDGSSKAGYTAVSVEGQSRVVRLAQRAAEVEPESVTYLETHGLGTPLGDILEIDALKKAFSKTDKKQFCRLGSLKANIGHLDAASGVAGLIKTVMALKHRCIPPSINYDKPNPGIDFENSPFYIGKTPEEWHSDDYPLRAGVSCFGIGGTNAHVILEEWNQEEAKTVSPETLKYHVFPLSAKSETALEAISANLAGHLREQAHINLADAAYTMQVGRSDFNYRQLLVCSSKEEAITGLAALTSTGQKGEPQHPVMEVETEKPPVVFLFPGLDSQYAGMGTELYSQHPLFRQETGHCLEILESLTGGDRKELLGSQQPGGKEIPPEIAAALLFGFEYALGQLLLQGGIKPQVMLGDGLGHYAAACLGGELTPEDALKKIIAGEQAPQETGQTGLDNGKTGLYEDRLKQWLQNETVVFVEVGPGDKLTAQVRRLMDDTLQHRAVNLTPPPDNSASHIEYLLNQAGQLWLNGVSVDWGVVCGHEKRKRVPLPVYPFDKLAYSIRSPLKTLELEGGEGDSFSAAAPDPDLPPNRPPLKTEYVAPRDAVEEALAEIWRELLGIRPIGIHDDLMELGVNSLKGLTFVNRFKDKYDATIHVAALFEGPTVAELAAYFRDQYPENAARLTGAATGAEAGPQKDDKEVPDVNVIKSKIPANISKNLVLLSESSTPKAGNIFLVHEVSGDIGAYIEFGRLLDVDLNVWGMQANKLKNYQPQNRSIEEVAGGYYEKIKTLQPEGPYYLMTWSGGGTVGFELALQVEESGEPLAFLGLIDCRGPECHYGPKAPQCTLETEKGFLNQLFAGTSLVKELEKANEIDKVWPLVVKVLKADPSYQPMLDAFIKQDRMLTLLNFEGQQVEALIQYMNLSRTFGGAAGRYSPARKLQTPLHFFEGTEADTSKPLFWQDYCANPIIDHSMPGDHYNIFKQPNVTEFARTFSQAVRGVKG
ncbi:MAG: acyltransferase domain-containing protein [bacterium]|nr:acyltransferase domain-containing protein [bacterium]